jgi:hypothetical protein
VFFYCYRVIGVNKIINIKERLSMTIKVIIKNILKKNKKTPTIHTKKTKQTKTKQVKKNQVIKRISEYILSIKIGNEISIFRRLYDILCFL